MNIKSDRGLSLITLVITAIVGVIIAGATFNILRESDVVDNAESLELRKTLSEVSEEWNMRKAKFEMDGIDLSTITYFDIKTATISVGETNFQEKLINCEISDEINEKMKIISGELVYVSKKCTEEDLKVFKEQGIRSDEEVN